MVMRLLKGFKKKVQVNRRILEACSPYLRNGYYKINPTETILYLDSVGDKARFEGKFTYATQYLGRNLDLKSRLLASLFRCRVSGDNKLLNGSLLLLTSSRNEIKIFDYVSKKMVTIYSEADKASLVRKNRLYWSKYFKVIPFSVDTSNKISETIIDKVIYDTNDAFFDIIYAYKSYFKTIENELTDQLIVQDDLLDYFFKVFSVKVNYKEFRDLLESIPVCITHGDLWSANVLYDGEEFFHIDFENLNRRIFFYDVYMYMFLDAHIRNDNRILDFYFAGQLDNELLELFECSGIVYECDRKWEYLLCFLFTLFYERWNNEESKTVVSEVRELLDRY